MVKLDGRYAVYLINFGAGANVILPNYITERGFPLKVKEEPYILDLANGEIARHNNGRVNKEIDLLRLQIGL